MEANNKEIEKFSRLSHSWWNKEGEFKLLHKMNNLRVKYIVEVLKKYQIFSSLTILDAGCGGGILSESLAQLGHTVTGIDLSSHSIKVAQKHAALSKLNIDYRCTSISSLALQEKKFDIICIMEVLEHVENIAAFLNSSAFLLKPNGFLFFSTINKTCRSYLQAILCAEYLLRWVPIGTHEWKKFIKPADLYHLMSSYNLVTKDFSGMHYSFLLDEWSLKQNLDVNFIGYAIKEK